ncbi:hypothetical protein ACVWWN_008338 [Mycobacterium sp. URHB0021]
MNEFATVDHHRETISRKDNRHHHIGMLAVARRIMSYEMTIAEWVGPR